MTDSGFLVGGYYVGPGRIVSVGTYGNMPDGSHVYYNIEAYRLGDDSSRYEQRVSLVCDLTQTQLNTLNSTILNNNDWTVAGNCSYFAAKCWNSVSSTYLSAYNGAPMCTPDGLAASIRKVSGYYTKQSMSTRTIGEVYYQLSSGLKRVSDATTSILTSSSNMSSSR